MNDFSQFQRPMKPVTTSYLGPTGIASPYSGPLNRNAYKTAMEKRLGRYRVSNENPITGKSASGAKQPQSITTKGGE